MYVGFFYRSENESSEFPLEANVFSLAQEIQTRTVGQRHHEGGRTFEDIGKHITLMAPNARYTNKIVQHHF